MELTDKVKEHMYKEMDIIMGELYIHDNEQYMVYREAHTKRQKEVRELSHQEQKFQCYLASILKLKETNPILFKSLEDKLKEV